MEVILDERTQSIHNRFGGLQVDQEIDFVGKAVKKLANGTKIN